MHSSFSSLLPALPHSHIHLFFQLCIRAFIQHSFLLRATRFQALRPTSSLGPCLGPVPVGWTRSDNHGEEVIGTHERPVPCCGIQRRGRWSGLAAEAKVHPLLGLAEGRAGHVGMGVGWGGEGAPGRGARGAAAGSQDSTDGVGGVRADSGRLPFRRTTFGWNITHPVVHTLSLCTADRRPAPALCGAIRCSRSGDAAGASGPELGVLTWRRAWGEAC